MTRAISTETFIQDTCIANKECGMTTMMIQVRNVREAARIGVRQLRTKKNRWAAAVWSDMDVTVMTRSGKVYQLDHSEFNNRSA